MSEKEDAESTLPPAEALRREAQRRLRDKNAAPVESMAEVDVRALLHKLQVHQVELEMQNEELLRAQAAVKDLSDKYHDLFDFAPIGYFHLDGQGRILEVNLAGAALLGLDRSAAVKRRFGQYVAPHARASFAEFLSDVLQADGKQTREIQLQRNEEDEEVYAVVEGVPSRDGGANDSLRVTVIDVTDRKRAEEERAKIQDTLQRTLNSITDCHYMLDRQWRFTRINDHALHYFAMEREDLLGRCYWQVFPNLVGTVLEEYYKTADSQRIPVTFDVFSPVTARWAEVHAYPSEDGLAVYFKSITDRKRAEEVLQELNTTLEQRVAQRTAELAQQAEQLRVLALELTQAEQRERRRLAQVLHDHLQQLLVAARMKVGRLRRRIQDGQLLQTIAELDAMLNETIEESRSLAVQLCPPVLYVSGLAAALEWLGRQTREKFNLAVEVQADPAAEPAEEAPRVFLFQAAGELLLNAAKHARAHCVQVRMTRVLAQPSQPPAGQTPGPPGPEQVCIEVCDDGVGFDPGQMVRKPGGGFGMFSIRQRLEVFGGHLEIHSSPGQGTQVTLWAPLGKKGEERL